MSSSSYSPSPVGTSGSDSPSWGLERVADHLAGRVTGSVPAPTRSRAECDVLTVGTTGRGPESLR